MKRPVRQLVAMLPIAPAILCATWLIAQQVSNRPMSGQINPQAPAQVNPGLYGTPMTGSVRHSSTTSMPMNSEVRYAYAAAGATPSEIRMGYARTGPNSPGGALDYIPPAPNYLGKSSPPPPVPTTPASYGSVRYSPSPSYSPASASAVYSPNLASQPMGGSISSGPINSAPINSAVRYAR